MKAMTQGVIMEDNIVYCPYCGKQITRKQAEENNWCCSENCDFALSRIESVHHIDDFKVR